MQSLRQLQADLDAGKTAILADGTSSAVTWLQNMSGVPGVPKAGGRVYGGMVDGQSVSGVGLDAVLAEVGKLKPELATHELWQAVTLEEAAASAKAGRQA